MTEQNYLVVENNLVTNVVVWDGGSDWTPPTDATMLIQATTPAMVWQWNGTAWVLAEEIGQVQIGFTWDGAVLTTNQPQPTNPPKTEPVATGLQTA